MLGLKKNIKCPVKDVEVQMLRNYDVIPRKAEN